jgi:hypothetical protein
MPNRRLLAVPGHLFFFFVIADFLPQSNPYDTRHCGLLAAI